MPGWMGLSGSVCPQGAGLLLFPDLPSQATGPNSASPGKRQEQSSEFTGPGMFIAYRILQTLYLCGLVLWLLALLPPLVRESHASFLPWYHACVVYVRGAQQRSETSQPSRSIL